MIGIAHFGKTDVVLGWGHVATRFLHVAYVPLLPVGTVHVTDDEVTPLAFSWRSAALGWLGGATLVMCLGGLLVSDDLPALAATLIVGAVALFSALQLPRLRHATWERAMAIADAVEARPVRRVKLAQAYGKISDEAAQRGIEKLSDPAELSDEERWEQRVEALDRVVESQTRAREERLARERAELESRIQRKASRAPFGLAVTTRSPSAVKFACPHCLNVSKVPAVHAGRKGRCRHCRGRLRVPPPLAVSGVFLAA